jgi:hypothetical protein
MDNIIEPNETFDFSNLSLAHPSGVQGGAYFTKIEYNKKPLYIQTTKSLTRQGFVKTGKKYYCDLMFDKNAETLIHWFENLEEKCQKLIYEKRESWFQNSLEECDIESAFNSLIRVYKSGKYYLVRTNIKNNRLEEPAVKIYNENEVSLTTTDITTETNIISILEIQGIKFTSRNFQIEVELKQIMVLDNEPIFESCLIKGTKSKQSIHNSLERNDETITKTEGLEELPHLENTKIVLELPELPELKNKDQEVEEPQGIDVIDIENMEKLKDDSNVLNIDAQDLNEEPNDEPKELKEINIDFDFDLDLDDKQDALTLKKPNQVYFELYKEARQKAKQAKKNAIVAYLEAKNIKKTYMIENINDSDSDFDAEIEEASESELDNF